MSKVITATFVDGVFKPDEPLNIPPQTRVRLLIVDPVGLDWSPEEAQRAWEELEQLWQEVSIDSGGVRLTRDQLHERR
jgi:predicted DNA-binding antitoxin AbrB/MazE fold protein